MSDAHDDGPMSALAMACAATFAAAIDAEEVDVVDLPDEGAVEVQADEWTLHLEGDPIALAFFAIENEPDQADAAALTQALQTALTPDDLASLRALDADLGGTLTERLAASGDALSASLATLLQAAPPA